MYSMCKFAHDSDQIRKFENCAGDFQEGIKMAQIR